MTQREKTMMTGLGALVALVGGGALLYLFAWVPVRDANARADAARNILLTKQGELKSAQAQQDAILAVNPRLREMKKISLSPRDPSRKSLIPVTDAERTKHMTFVQGDYRGYLDGIMQKNKVKVEKLEPKQIEKQQANKGTKQPQFEKISFNLIGRGQLDHIVDMLVDFHRTPLLHQIRTVKVEALAGKDKTASEGDLQVTVNTEALLLNEAAPRETLLPSQLDKPIVVLAEPTRDYKAMAKKNMFTGVKPPPPPKVVTEDKTPKEEVVKTRPKEDKALVLRFVRVTTLCYDSQDKVWEAWIWDQNRGPTENKLNAPKLNTLTVYDKYNEVTLDAKVVHIDARQLIFTVDKKFYRARCGDTLWAAYAAPLGEEDLAELGILQ